MRSSLLPGLGTWIVAFARRAVYGLAGTIAHAYTLGWFPLGLVLAIIGCAALLAAVRLLTGDRWATLATGLGMMIATLVFSGRGPGGSVIVPQTDARRWSGRSPCRSSSRSRSPGRSGCAPVEQPTRASHAAAVERPLD